MKIEAKVKQDQTSDFLLSSELSRFMDCISDCKIDRDKFDNLLDIDIKIWEEEFEERKEKRDTIVESLT